MAETTLKFKRSKTFVFFAAKDHNGFCDGKETGVFAKRAAELLKANAPKRLLAELRSKKTVLVYPWQWQSPKVFGDDGEVLGADAWNNICVYIVQNYGAFRYNPKSCRPCHAVSRQNGIAAYRITAKL